MIDKVNITSGSKELELDSFVEFHEEVLLSLFDGEQTGDDAREMWLNKTDAKLIVHLLTTAFKLGEEDD